MNGRFAGQFAGEKTESLDAAAGSCHLTIGAVPQSRMVGPYPRHLLRLFAPNVTPAATKAAGLRVGAVGTHTSRTIMLSDLETLFAEVPANGSRTDYARAIIERNCLAKRTTATRSLSNQRLGELYGLDPAIPVFRVFRRLWSLDPDGRPLLALLTAIARDPLLAATCAAVVPLPPGAELQREPMKELLHASVGERLNEDTLRKVCRNAASSWTQSGHLEGRTIKKRRLVRSTPATVAFALYLAHAAGFRGLELFSSGWLQLLDCDPGRARRVALEAKQMKLVDLKMAGDVVELSTARLDPMAATV